MVNLVLSHSLLYIYIHKNTGTRSTPNANRGVVGGSGGGGGRGGAMGGPTPTGAAAHSRRGPGSRGGTGPKPNRFRVASNSARLRDFDAATRPNVALQGDTDHETIIHILEGSSATEFQVQVGPRGEATLHYLLIHRLNDFDFGGRKSLVQQRQSLHKARFFSASAHPVMEGEQGTFWEQQAICGRLVPLKATKDPGAGRINYTVLSWLDEHGRFK